MTPPRIILVPRISSGRYCHRERLMFRRSRSFLFLSLVHLPLFIARVCIRIPYGSPPCPVLPSFPWDASGHVADNRGRDNIVSRRSRHQGCLLCSPEPQPPIADSNTSPTSPRNDGSTLDGRTTIPLSRMISRERPTRRRRVASHLEAVHGRLSGKFGSGVSGAAGVTPTVRPTSGAGTIMAAINEP